MKIVLVDFIEIINHATVLCTLEKLKRIRLEHIETASVDPLEIGHKAVWLCEKLSATAFKHNIIFLLIGHGNMLTNPYVTDKIECLQEASYWCGIREKDRHAWREQGVILPPSMDISAVSEQVRRAYESGNRFVRTVSLGIDYRMTVRKLSDAASIYEIEEIPFHKIIGDDPGMDIVVDPYKFYSSISGRDLWMNSCEGIHDYLNSQADLIVRQIIN